MSRAAAKTTAPTAAPRPQVVTPTAESEASHVSQSLGPGSPLPTTTRARMEHAFGQSFGDVRVHTDGAAARATAKHEASALTVGSSIAFAPGMFRPGTAGGDHLIAHELAHVVQQAGSGAAAQARSIHSVSTEGAEQQAESAAARVTSGLSAGIARGGFALSTRARVMRRGRALNASLPVMSATPMPGSGIAPTGPSMSPAMTTQVSSAGARPVGVTLPAVRPSEVRDTSPQGLRGAIIARATRAAEGQKTPDQAQTAIPRDKKSPRSVMEAGAPAGAGEGTAEAGGEDKGGDKKRKKKKKGEREGEREKKEGEGEAPAGGGPLRRRRTRRFGHIPGDRGAASAQRALRRLHRRTVAQQHHGQPNARIEQARNAAVPPPTENLSRAQGSQLTTVAGEPAPRTDADSANRNMEREVDAAAPQNMQEMSDYDPAHLRATINSSVNAQVVGIQTSLTRVNEVPTPAPTPQPGDQLPQEPAPTTAAPNSAAAVPPPVPETTLDASEYREDADAVFAENEVSERARQNASEGPLRDMRNQEEGIDQAVESASQRVRDREIGARTEAQGELRAADEEAEARMMSTRERVNSRADTVETGTRTGEETDRQTVTEQIEGLYTSTATYVNNQLSTLTQTTTQQFDTDQARYLDEFKANTRRDIAQFKRDRYSTPVVGWGRWVKDRFVSINKLSRVKTIYKTNRDAYVSNITGLINRLTAQADAIILSCRTLITVTQLVINALVEAQPPRLQAEARAAQQRVNQQFQQLERQIEQTGNQVRNALEARRERAMEAVDQALAEIQAENASLVDRLVAFVNAIVNALKQFFKLMVRIEEMGIGTFLSRALEQAKNGVKHHLWNELKQAFQEWLMMKLSFLTPLLLLPSNFLEVLTSAAMNLMNLFLEALPEALPELGLIAMAWLAVSLAAKLIPGVGAIMAVIDAIRAAWSLIQSLIRAASAFFSFLMMVAGGGDGSQQFARALAWGIIAAVDALLTFLGVDRLLRLIARPIGRPMGRILGRLSQRRTARRTTRQERRRREREEHARTGQRRGDDHHRERSEAGRARAERRAEANRRQTTGERHTSRSPSRTEGRRRDPDNRRNEQRRRREQERRRRNQERLARAQRELPGAIRPLLDRGVRGVVLRGRLALLRVRYRLSALRVIDSGRTFRIVAAVNPTAHIIDGVEMDVDALLRFIRVVAERIRRSPRVRREAARIRRSERTQRLASQSVDEAPKGRAIRVPAGTSHAGVAEGMASLPTLERGRVRDIEALGAPPRPGAQAPVVSTVRQQQSRFRALPTTPIIHHRGPTGERESGKYRDIAARTATGFPEAARGPMTALALDEFARTGVAPAGFTADQLHALRMTMFGAEGPRSPAAAVFGHMSMDLMRRGSTPEDILGKTAAGGLHPMSPERVGTDVRALEERLGRVREGEAVGPPTAAEQRQMDREVAIIRAWVQTLDLKFDDNASKEQKEATIRAEIERRLVEAANEV